MSYSWGSDSSLPRRTGGYDYGKARRAHTPRSYGKKPAGSSGRSYRRKRSGSIPDALNRKIKTNSPNPLVFALDVTGSMQEWPNVIFEKLPLLYDEAKRYLRGTEISFCAIGDSTCDRHPLQVCDFAKDKALDDLLSSLCAEGGGGRGLEESYELAAYFYLNHCEIPKAKKPILIMTGDENFYDEICPSILEAVVGDKAEVPTQSKKVFKDLCSKFNVYLIRKRYGRGYDSEITQKWRTVLDADNIVTLEDPRRIVDCSIGIIAACAGKFDDYSQRLSERQTVTQVSQVMDSLKDVSKKVSKKTPANKPAKKPAAGKSKKTKK